MRKLPKLTVQSINQGVVRSEYAVRGKLPMMAAEIKQKLLKDPKAFAFPAICELNIGNPQKFTTETVTLSREILAEMILSSLRPPSFEPKSKTKNDLNPFFASMSEYRNLFSFRDDPHGPGPFKIRESVARFIEKRDRLKSDPDDIVLTNGASAGIQTIMKFLLSEPKSGIMLPIPQYPLYSATTTIYNAELVPYYLNESDEWNVDIASLQTGMREAQKKGVKVKAITLINPGNPTGNVFDQQKMREVLKFAHEHKLVVLADEVYQENVYGSREWVSFKKILHSMDEEVRRSTQVISFHSISKGLFGECGLRGGYYELTNVFPDFKRTILEHERQSKPNLAGAIVLDVKSRILASHFEGFEDCAYLKQANAELDKFHHRLKLKAEKFFEVINSTPGLKTNRIEGAMYGFPRISLPKKFIQKCEREGVLPDAGYCMELLNETGIVVVPGSGFGQEKGTFHFRTTVLVEPIEKFLKTLATLKEFNTRFQERFA